MMNVGNDSDTRVSLLKIQNSRKPGQVIYLIWDRSRDIFVTEGLKDLFSVKEIRIGAANSMEVVQSIAEYAQVLSYLLETMSTAQDLNLPYGYQNEFDVDGKGYSLMDEGEYRVLKPLTGIGPLPGMGHTH